MKQGEYNSEIMYSFLSDQSAMVFQYFMIDSENGLIRTREALTTNETMNIEVGEDLKLRRFL